MVESTREVPFLKNIGLLMTYKCQVNCPHCIIEAGPHRTEEMSLDDASDWIQQIANYRSGHVRVLSFTGGEPFIDIEKLRKLSTPAEEQNLFATAVTNAYWAHTFDAALKVLHELPAIKLIQVSTDEYHQLTIPFVRVKNAIQAAQLLKIPHTVAVCTENPDSPKYLQIIKDLEEITDPGLIITAITFRAGRAYKQSTDQNYKTTNTPPQSACGAGGAPIIFPDGRVIACIGPIVDLKTDHPLVLGSLRENTLSEILDKAEQNSVLHAIRLWGPKKLIKMCEEAGLGSQLPKLYVEDSTCHACYELMVNPYTAEYLAELNKNEGFAREVAYGRVYYLQEPYMAFSKGYLSEQQYRSP